MNVLPDPLSGRKILFISSPLTWRGGEQQLAYLLEILTENNVAFGVVCPVKSAFHRLCTQKGYQVHSFVFRGIFNLVVGLFVYRICKRYRYSLLHANDSHAHMAAVWSSVLGCKAPVVLHRRVDFPVKNTFFSRKKYNWPAIAAIICISEEVKRVLEPAVYNKKIIHVINSGIDLKRFEQGISTSVDLRKLYNIPAHKKIVGIVAALAAHKDHKTFVETAELVLTKRDDVVFIAIGEGKTRNKTETLIKQKELTGKVIIAGFMHNIPAILPQLDCFLLTSQTEGMGTSLLDAFAAGIPVVATNAGGIPEIIIHQKTGLLAPVKDAKTLSENVSLLLDDQNMRKYLVSQAKKHLQRFTYQEMGIKTIRIYQMLLEKK
ncbi:MAG: glycosyltransferase [Bacteroidota bacterium]